MPRRRNADATAAHALQRRSMRRVVAAFTERLGLKATAICSRDRALVRRQREGAADRARDRALHARAARQLARASRSAAAVPGDRRRLAEGAHQAELEPAGDSPTDHGGRARYARARTCGRKTSRSRRACDAVVRDVQPRSLTLRFEPTWTRKVPVTAAAIDVVDRAGRRSPFEPQFDPEVVQISGPRHLVLKIPSAQHGADDRSRIPIR